MNRLNSYFPSVEVFDVLLFQGRGTRAVFQLYPDSSDQIELLTLHAMKAGFMGGVVIDFPNSSKAKK